jgi:hypothetical protein
MFPEGFFLLNLILSDMGTVPARGFVTDPSSIDPSGASTSSQGFLYSYVTLNHMLHPKESFVL